MLPVSMCYISYSALGIILDTSATSELCYNPLTFLKVPWKLLNQSWDTGNFPMEPKPNFKLLFSYVFTFN